MARNQEKEVKDIHDFPMSFLAHLEIAKKEKDRRLMKAYHVEEDKTFKKHCHKTDITRDLYYNVLCGDVGNICQRKTTYCSLPIYLMAFAW